jgi:hypothetical protein
MIFFPSHDFASFIPRSGSGSGHLEVLGAVRPNAILERGIYAASTRKRGRTRETSDPAGHSVLKACDN